MSIQTLATLNHASRAQRPGAPTEAPPVPAGRGVAVDATLTIGAA